MKSNNFTLENCQMNSQDVEKMPSYNRMLENLDTSEGANELGFESMSWLFTCNNLNRGIMRLNFDEAALIWSSIRDTDGEILEVGRKHGGSTVLICTASAGRKVTSIDIAPEHNPLVEPILNNAVEGGKLQLLTADSRQSIPGAEFGLLFIDGDHSYEGVLADVLAHWSSLQTSTDAEAIAIFHDAVPNNGLHYIDEVNHCLGVTILCEQLVEMNVAEAISQSGSVLVMKKTGELPQDFVDERRQYLDSL